jgi:predicted ATPase
MQASHSSNKVLAEELDHPISTAFAVWRAALTNMFRQDPLELRAATKIARLWSDQGKLDDARDLLESVYDWITEGLYTPDLIEAKALLAKLT